MKRPPPLAVRIAVTTLVVALAIFAGWRMWVHYQVEPWTRDGRVRAEVVQVSADVAGLVESVDVVDNQRVVAGQTLFVIDRARFDLAVQRAEAALVDRRAAFAQIKREVARNRELGELVAAEENEQTVSRLQQAQAAVDQAVSARDLAKLDRERANVRAPSDGLVTNLSLRAGDYLQAGHQALALVEEKTFHVDGYFEETKLPRIHVGDRVAIRIMGERTTIYGHVQGVASGIEDRERALGADLLPNVNPTFSWVRLPQRIPVRVTLDGVPSSIRLVSGRTATVNVLGPDPERPAADAKEIRP
ncbi:Membrane fusion component of tripartite multidrug resistance system [Labilithrix luteola]|uniref:Membrane fusion component of tripartite multidrug resistance system n=1 Tax=Labilithrix luteola TaxID=1391654 RepID=A0A0K1QD72_9BACT|nr:biotin/lipoyl-binding protein [Labilithrix luteola]AKV03706.1 Membrane fusion component of tripartite multidrug resistance system [Labilithrix luteola]